MRWEDEKKGGRGVRLAVIWSEQVTFPLRPYPQAPLPGIELVLQETASPIAPQARNNTQQQASTPAHKRQRLLLASECTPRHSTALQDADTPNHWLAAQPGHTSGIRPRPEGSRLQRVCLEKANSHWGTCRNQLARFLRQPQQLQDHMPRFTVPFSPPLFFSDPINL